MSGRVRALDNSSRPITVQINEKKVTLPYGSAISDALAAAGYQHQPDTVIGIVSGREEKRREVATEFRVLTSKGEFKIELTAEAAKRIWIENYGRLVGCKARWTTAQAIAFGPIPSGIEVGKGEHEYARWEVSFGTGGYDARNTYLILSKASHSSDYGVKGGGVLGRVVSGRNVLASLGDDDVITGIEPVIRLESFASKIVTTDTSTKLEDGMEIYSRAEVELLPKAKDGAEHFYAAVKNGFFKVDFVTSSFISTDTMLGELCPYENLAARSEGTISVRTSGKGRGRIYISKQDMTSNVYHSIVGRVIHGMELVKMVSPGQKIAIKTIPKRLSMMGYGFEEAGNILDAAGVKYEKAGYQGKDAVIVDQSPRTTMEIISSGNVKLTGVPQSNLIEIHLYDDLAPNTSDYFRKASGLKEHRVGALPVFFKYEETMLFKGKPVATGSLIPENKPKEGSIVKGGDIALTNMASKHEGMIGVRFSDNDKFGPTGEKYAATNIVGRVINVEKLKKLKEKDMVYFKEV
ncbi:methyl-coenzyme M reductase-associated protein Mmp3 [Methanocella conradii]|uniref:methyl-coenzyme M reductase-associated protein Mmp3 n=1 Tax=Methanocella conradii TaxID=1175444 RepID=UPI0024B3C527|nr:methanogenesis marker 3 protein [Methanocella conradii]MDI6896292.1 methanogenesis marker 3 protein [Methanocella conradii]